MTQKHTVLPWRLEKGTTLIWGECNPDDMTSHGMGYPISQCRLAPSGPWAKGPKSYEEAEANAEFIVRACNSHYELLDALKRMTAEAKMDGMEERAGWDCWISLAEKAIAKAEGGAA